MPILGQSKGNTPSSPSGGILQKAREKLYAVPEGETFGPPDLSGPELGPPAPTFFDKLSTTFEPEINAVKNIPNFISQLPGMAADAFTAPGEQIMNSDELPGRDTPIIGPVFRGLDSVANNRLVQTIGGLGRDFYVPGASLENLGAFTNAAENGISRILPGIEGNAAGRFAQSAATNAALGGLLGTGQALTSQTNDLREALDSGLVGGVLGGALGVGGGILRSASQAARSAAETGLAVASSRPSLGAAVDDFISRTKAPETPYNLPNDINLPSLTDSVRAREPQILPAADAAYGDQLAGNLRRGEQYQQEYDQAIKGQQDYLKQSLNNRGGVDQGGVIKDPVTGEVIDRYGRISNNPKWFQDFYAENGRVPNQKDLETLAKKQIDNGYQEDIAQVPSFRPKELDEIDQQLAEINQAMPHADAETRQSLTETANILQTERDRLAKLMPEAPRTKYESPASTFGIYAFAKSQDYGITNPMDTRSRIVTKTKAEPTKLETKLRKGYSKTFDDVQTINSFDKDVESTTGKPLAPSDKAYMKALNSRGADMVSRHILTDTLVDSQGNAIGKSLKAITSQMPRNQLLNFEDYLINKDAAGRMERGIKVFPDEMGMTAEKSRGKVAEYEAKYPQFKQLSEQLYEFKNQMGKSWLVDTGILSPQQWEAFQNTNAVHVPMRRLFSDIERPSGNQAKRGFANQTNPIKKAVGSERKIISPLESIIEDVDRWVKTAKRNEVMQTVYKNLLKSPEDFKGWAEIVEQPERLDDVSKISMDGEGIDEIVHRFNETFEKALKKPDLTKGNVLRVMVDGQPKYIKVHDPQFLESLTFLKPEAQNVVVHAARQATRVMKLLTTGANPVFGLARNIFRDIPMAFISSKSTNNPLRFGVDLADGFISALGNGELYRSFKAVGGGHSSSIAADRNLLAQSKNAILPQQMTPKTLVSKILGGVENFNNALESAPRLGEFKRIVKQGGNSYDSKIKGLYEANDVTVNFNRAGRYSRDIDAFVPYFNAALQGLDKLTRIFKDNPVQATAKAVAAITVPSILMYVLNHDNPEYQKLSNNIKDNYFLIPLPDGTFAKIAKPREAGMVFGTAVERALRAWNNEDPNAFKDFAESVKTNFLPPVIGGAISREPLTGALRDTIAGPAVDVGMNKNFLDSPIVPGYLQGGSPRYQYDQNTSELSKFVGDKVNYSPMKLDYLIKSYGGVLGQLGIPATAKGSTVGETLKKQVTADPLYSNDLVRDFYDKKETLDTAQTDFKQNQGKSDEYNNNLRLYFNRVSDQMSEVRKQIRAIEQNNALSDEQKKGKIREQQAKINSLAQTALGR